MVDALVKLRVPEPVIEKLVAAALHTVPLIPNVQKLEPIDSARTYVVVFVIKAPFGIVTL